MRADDLAQVNRIFQRFKLGVNNKATISQSIEKARNADPAEPQHNVPEKSAEDRFLDKLFQQPQAEKTENTNPSMERMENAHPSAPTLKSNEDLQKYEEEAFTSKDECRAHLSPEQLEDYTEWEKSN